MNISLVTLIALVTTAAACSSTAGSSPTSSAAQDLTASDSPTSAVDVLRKGGTFMFALDESDPATYIRSMCAKQGGDAAACYAHVKAEGDQEGLRFTPNEGGQTLWTSFGPRHEPAGGEEIYLQVALTLSAQGNATVVGTQAGPIVGVQRHPAAFSHPLEFEVVDANTIVQKDAEKGKLVFHRVD